MTDPTPPGTAFAAVAEAWRIIRQACDGEADRLRRLCLDPEAVQRQFLAKLVEANARSRFGIEHGFAAIHSYDDYAKAVPIQPYAAFRPYIERAIEGASGELTSEPILFAELTGGSTGGSKIIPYTRSALRGYSRAVVPWMAGLLEQWPRVAGGRAYFALSPMGRSGDERIGVVPLGSPEQFDYFGDCGDSIAAVSVAPHALAALTDIADWQFATCLHLLAARDLSLIWIWSPTFLVELLHVMQRRKTELVEALGRGAGTAAPAPAPQPERAKELTALLGEDRIDTARIWPDLTVISCWMDASSAPFAAMLQEAFPNVAFQAKGLMATEGATTLPFGSGQGSPLALESGFFEFADEHWRTKPAWELEQGEVRRLILSNHCGLYRYDTEDLVEVVGFEGATPRLSFVGRAGQSTDLCGEKLAEPFVLRCLEHALAPHGGYAFLAPATRPRPHYALWLDGSFADADIARLAGAVDEALHENPQYAYARRLGQLDPVEGHASEDLFEKYRAWASTKGKTIGMMKAAALLSGIPEDLVEALRATGAASAGEADRRD